MTEPAVSTDPLTDYRSYWTELMHVSYQIGWLDAGGVRTRYLEAGDPERPTVVMVHSIGSSLELFLRNIGPLSEHFHVLAFDFVGFGLSDKAERDLEIEDYVNHLEAFLAAKDVENVMLFATSLGSWASVMFADQFPERVEKMILIAPAGLLLAPEGMARFSQEQAIETVDHPTWERLNKTFDHLLYDETSRFTDLLAVRRLISLEPGMALSTRRIMSLLDPDVMARNAVPESVYRNLKADVLLVECPDTEDLSFHMVQAARDIIPGCQVLSVPRTAHWPHFEEPEIVNPAAIRFLQGRAASAS